ncbi:MAG TPA: GDSL-type esterase/lipase family protein [Rariglobus sp.]|jgi:lysophospholipase L1-like esterase|nr:GDSL-type esterase/lipase family protein [Rariglobus sp.]
MPRITLIIASLLSFVVSPVMSSAATRIACVGDSITAGSGLKDARHEAWPSVLGELLGPNYDVGNFGVSGATLLVHGNKPYWNEAAFPKADAFAPKIVIIALGTNDSKAANWDTRHGEFLADANALVDHFAKLPSKPQIWLCLPPPIFSHAYGIDEPNAAKIRTILRSVAAAHHLKVIDPGSAMNHKAEMFPDGVHPNADGAKAMAGVIAAALKSK